MAKSNLFLIALTVITAIASIAISAMNDNPTTTASQVNSIVISDR